MRDVEVPTWLQGLRSAPEFRPTDTEFADPIAYISKIEKEASVFGICKVIPPFPKPSKKYVTANLNKALSKCPELGSDACSSSKLDAGEKRNDGEFRAVFTTRHQELGQSGKRIKGMVQFPPPAVQKQVWQSGEIYTLEQFECKAKNFARNQLSMVKESSPLVIESLFWQAACEKPIYIEYANDVPGSGFGEPGGSFRFFRKPKRRRRRTFNRNGEKCSDDLKDREEKLSNSSEKKEGFTSPTPCSSVGISATNDAAVDILLDKTLQVSRRKSIDATNHLECTSGWKLSNSPWNLQVISRSPGSLTRFLPDDIPGVTSPMVYIGMLFSWFAWHVEDHELHSLNFLHTGSPKTWYAVPGDYAFTFEEVIRSQAYGGNIDRLAALTLLGEKTTLLSPEVVVASGIPCCRLVQNPGEFVVTFPRAYHIGFSHGFNCGEAANFGTPKWLSVAKGAAVRRAAMNHLPMLSHQHLLYLLTMSFISRVPRSLLPGVRSSRLKDRQKEEREVLVKKAFVEDMLNENRLLTALLQKNSSYRAVLWDLDSLPFSVKAFDLTGNQNIEPENDNDQDLFSQMRLCLETIDDLYTEDDDVSSDFQLDSGSLPCVACGVLGFPFMSVIQPSEKALVDVLPADFNVPEGLNARNSHVASVLNRTTGKSFSGCPNSAIEDKGWNTSSPYLRPRIFCLEHASEIEDLFHSKGGAEVLVICHSDFRKIRANASAIAEEIGSPFRYKEIPLENASSDDLNLINFAIDDEGNDCLHDWTTDLNINLQRCVKLRNNSSSENMHHPLTLDGLFSDSTPSSHTLILKWQSRKSRSRQNVNFAKHNELSESDSVQKQEVLGVKLDNQLDRKAGAIIQYTRRSLKTKPLGYAADLDQNERTQNSSLKPNSSASVEKSEVVQANKILVETSDVCNSSLLPLPPTDSVEITESVIENNSSREMPMTDAVHDANEGNVQCDISLLPPLESVEITKSLSENNFSREMIMTDGVDDAIEGNLKLQNEISDTENLENSSNSLPAAFQMAENDTIDCGTLTKVDNRVENEFDLVAETAAFVEQNTKPPMDSCKIEEPNVGVNCSFPENGEVHSKNSIEHSEKEHPKNSKKRKMEVELQTEEGFIRSPCEGLRPRVSKGSINRSDQIRRADNGPPDKKKEKKHSSGSSGSTVKKEDRKCFFRCNIEGCKLSFRSRPELRLHQRNRCSHKGCGKKFSTHKYAVLHTRVHRSDRPLECSWKGCNMTFKWAWARTEHLRVHTGEKPYKCKVEGCDLAFRFISDFSRHRRKTGHYI